MTRIEFPKKDGVDVKYAVRALIILLAAVAAGLVSYTVFQNFAGYLELAEIGNEYTVIFWQNTRTKLLLGGITFMLTFALFYVNHSMLMRIIANRDSAMEQFQKPLLAFFLSFVFAFLCGRMMGGEIYDSFLTFVNRTDFGYGDPLFNRDIGYYVFARPFLLELIRIVTGIWLGLLLYTLAVYLITAARLSFLNRKILKETALLNHLAVLAVGFVLVQIARYRFALEEMLYSTFGGLNGAGHTQQYVWGVYYRLAPILALLLLATAIVLFLRKRFRGILLTLLVFPVCLLATFAAARVTDVYVVAPSAFSLQQTAIQTNWYMTRRGFDLENLLTDNETEVGTLTRDTLLADPAASAALNNLKLADTSAETLAPFRQGEQYYFGNVRYQQRVIDGQPTLVFVAPRESSAPSQAGAGLIMGYASRTDSDGNPVLLMEGLPVLPRTHTLPELQNTELYFSNQATEGLTLSADSDGRVGVPMTFWNRVAFLLKNRDNPSVGKVDTTDYGLFNRKITDRLNRLAPFFRYGTPYVTVTDDGRVLWLTEAYAVTDRYPFAQTYDGVNYIRNVATVSVDAYDGTVRFYRNAAEPISDTYKKIYPALFTAEPIPEDVARLRRGPELLHKLQMQVLEQYHETDLEQFYLRQGAWNCAKFSQNGEEAKRLDPALTWVALPDAQGNKQTHRVFLTLFTDKNGANVTAAFLTDLEPASYGKKTLLVFPNTQPQMTPQAFDTGLATNAEYMLRQVSWQSAGLTVVRGSVSPVLVHHALIYAEPIYSLSATGEKRLIAVAMGNGKRTVVRNTSADCLNALLEAGELIEGPTQQLLDMGDLIDAVVQAYDRVRESGAQNDWPGYGNALNELESAIRQLESGKKSLLTDGDAQPME